MERSDSGQVASSELAWRDDLTGVWNRRFLRRLLADDWPRLTTQHASLTLLLLDLDDFKPVNDRFGHPAGDRVLRWAADELRRGFRETDRLIRYGGDEFVVILPDVDAREARDLAERARAGFAAVSLDDAEGGKVDVPISFSLGVASFPEDGARGEELLAIADRRLYEEKRRRRADHPASRGGAEESTPWKWVIAALVTVAVGAIAATVAYRQARRLPAPPPPIAAPADSAAGGSVANEIVIRDEAELRELRAEVERLRFALSQERAEDERAQYEARIRELESKLQSAESGAAAPEPSGSAEIEAATGLRIGERRVREDLPAAAPAGEAQAATEAVAAPSETPAPAAAASGSAVVVPPRLLRSPRLDYPPLARRHRREAIVELELTVDAEGKVVAVETVGAPAGLGFDEAARQAGRAARFAPGTRDGVAVAMQTRLTIRFQLEPGERRR